MCSVHGPMGRTHGPLSFSVTTAETGGSWAGAWGLREHLTLGLGSCAPLGRRLRLVFSQDCASGDVWGQPPPGTRFPRNEGERMRAFCRLRAEKSAAWPRCAPAGARVQFPGDFLAPWSFMMVAWAPSLKLLCPRPWGCSRPEERSSCRAGGKGSGEGSSLQGRGWGRE